MTYSRYSALESDSEEIQIQDVNKPIVPESNQLRGLICHDRSEGRLLPHFHPSTTQGVSEVFFWGQNAPISVSTILPSGIPSHLHEMHECSTGSIETPGHSCLYIENCSF